MVAASNNTEIYTIIASILGIILTFIQVKKNFKDEIKALIINPRPRRPVITS